MLSCFSNKNQFKDDLKKEEKKNTLNFQTIEKLEIRIKVDLMKYKIGNIDDRFLLIKIKAGQIIFMVYLNE